MIAADKLLAELLALSSPEDQVDLLDDELRDIYEVGYENGLDLGYEEGYGDGEADNRRALEADLAVLYRLVADLEAGMLVREALNGVPSDVLWRATGSRNWPAA